MTYRTEDETKLLREFLSWLIAAGWLKVDDYEKLKQVAAEFIKTRAIR